MMRNDPPARISERLVRNVQAVRARIRVSALHAGRAPSEVTLVAVTKTVSSAIVRLLPGAGIADLGENRVNAGEEKIREAPAGLRWHMIGPLQRNKARRALRIFSLFHALDSAKLLKHLDRIAEEEDRRVEGLIQVNISEEEQKHGVAAGELRALLDVATTLPRTRIMGLMGMGPFVDDPEDLRPMFSGLADLLADANRGGWYREPLKELSMGMTNDFEVAVQAGATMVRVGSAILEGVTEPDSAAEDEEP